MADTRLPAAATAKSHGRIASVSCDSQSAQTLVACNADPAGRAESSFFADHGHLQVLTLALCMALVACKVDAPTSQAAAKSSPAPASPTSPQTANTAQPAAPAPAFVPGSQEGAVDVEKVLPADFSFYDKFRLADGGFCVAGAMLKGDLAVQAPVVYRVSSDGRDIAKLADLPVPTGHYQARATHCAAADGDIFVLVQSDTQQSKSLSQTFLRAYRLPANNGAVSAVEYPIKPPDAQSAYSAWVESAPDAFVYSRSQLDVRGKYVLLSDKNTTHEFAVRLAIAPR